MGRRLSLAGAAPDAGADWHGPFRRRHSVLSHPARPLRLGTAISAVNALSQDVQPALPPLVILGLNQLIEPCLLPRLKSWLARPKKLAQRRIYAPHTRPTSDATSSATGASGEA